MESTLLVTVPDKIVTLHDFIFRIKYGQLHYMTGRFQN